MLLNLAAQEEFHRISNKRRLWTRGKAKGLVCFWLFGRNPSVTFPFNGPLVFTLKASLFPGEMTTTKYVSTVYYLLVLTTIPESLRKYKSELLVGKVPVRGDSIRIY